MRTTHRMTEKMAVHAMNENVPFVLRYKGIEQAVCSIEQIDHEEKSISCMVLDNGREERVHFPLKGSRLRSGTVACDECRTLVRMEVTYPLCPNCGQRM